MRFKFSCTFKSILEGKLSIQSQEFKNVSLTVEHSKIVFHEDQSDTSVTTRLFEVILKCKSNFFGNVSFDKKSSFRETKKYDITIKRHIL